MNYQKKNKKSKVNGRLSRVTLTESENKTYLLFQKEKKSAFEINSTDTLALEESLLSIADKGYPIDIDRLILIKPPDDMYTMILNIIQALPGYKEERQFVFIDSKNLLPTITQNHPDLSTNAIKFVLAKERMIILNMNPEEYVQPIFKKKRRLPMWDGTNNDSIDTNWIKKRKITSTKTQKIPVIRQNVISSPEEEIKNEHSTYFTIPSKIGNVKILPQTTEKKNEKNFAPSIHQT